MLMNIIQLFTIHQKYNSPSCQMPEHIVLATVVLFKKKNPLPFEK